MAETAEESITAGAHPAAGLAMGRRGDTHEERVVEMLISSD
jgi:hypothetical protein